MSSTSETALDLVGRIYDSAFQPALWADTLVRLTDALGGAWMPIWSPDGARLVTPVRDSETRNAKLVTITLAGRP